MLFDERPYQVTELVEVAFDESFPAETSTHSCCRRARRPAPATSRILLVERNLDLNKLLDLTRQSDTSPRPAARLTAEARRWR